jgi:uncharacterized protein involved in type VI secretion and phage assembly
MITADSGPEGTGRRFYGKYRGKVVDNADSCGRGRIKVRVPSVLGAEEFWALPCVPYAGKERGFFALPEAGTAVWVEFEHGDPSFPIWTGCFWVDHDIPSADARPAIKFWKTDEITIRIDDDEGSIEIRTAGASIRMTSQEIELKGSTVKGLAGGQKFALTAGSFDVNDGALTVV